MFILYHVLSLINFLNRNNNNNKLNEEMQLEKRSREKKKTVQN